MKYRKNENINNKIDNFYLKRQNPLIIITYGFANATNKYTPVLVG